MLRIAMLMAAAMLAGCSTVQDLVVDDEPDATLTAIENARLRDCPPGRTLENARIGSDNESSGVTSEDIALTPLASDPTRALRLRRLTVAPGGVIAWHTHEVNQGMALLVSGEMTEFRNTCLDTIRYRAGDVAREDAATAHGWRNESDEPAVFLVMHVVAR
jgi:quercetin dioxygenase-like cupin family protein